MIVKNEESSLSRCLDSVKDVADEIIIIDTGSTDRTKEIGFKYTHKVFDFKWCDDFSLARNFSMAYASGDWILFVDADEIWENVDSLRELMNADVDGWILSEKDYKRDSGAGFIVERKMGYEGYTISKRVRLFRNRGFRFRGRVHERIEGSILDSGGVIKPGDFSGVVVNHYSHAKDDYYSKLAEKKVKEDSKNWEAFLELGILYRKTGKVDDAIRVLKNGLNLKDSELLQYELGASYLSLKQFENAADCFKQVFSRVPTNPDALFGLGICSVRLGKLLEAEKWFLKVLEIMPKHVLALNNLGVVLEKLGKYKEAVDMYNRSIIIMPNNVDTYFNASVVLIKMRQFKAALKCIDKAIELGHGKSSMLKEMREQIVNVK